MKIGKSIGGAISYNERKVKNGSAELILASQFGTDINTLGFSQKLERFEKLNSLNKRSQTNTLHLSLNFAPGENLDAETMQKIAWEYMEQIGFGNQPYLVYQHFDAAHPHLHIVTNTIKADGKAIYLHNLGKRKSEPARRAIELEYNLVRAEDRKKQELPLSPASLEAARYGQSETKRSISNIVLQVVGMYKYTSLQELNAVLRQYNVLADGGAANSRMSQYQGLTYSIVDSNGHKTGLAVKASAIYSSPTLKMLEKKFAQNRIRKVPALNKLQERFSRIINTAGSRAEFMELLNKNKISCTVFKNPAGIITTISFIDNYSKSVFSSEELGFPVPDLLGKLDKKPGIPISASYPIAAYASSQTEASPVFHPMQSFDLAKTLVMAEEQPTGLPVEFLKKKRKKKKR